MPPLAVVEHFDIFEHLVAAVSSSTPPAPIDQFDFECGEKTFRHRVVPAIAFTAHAASDAVYRQQLLIRVAGVTLGCRSTFATRTALGSAALTRIPTAC